MKDDEARPPESASGVTRRDFLKISGIGAAMPLLVGPTVIEAAGEEVAVHGPGKVEQSGFAATTAADKSREGAGRQRERYLVQHGNRLPFILVGLGDLPKFQAGSQHAISF